jgi:hypothetical protein
VTAVTEAAAPAGQTVLRADASNPLTTPAIPARDIGCAFSWLGPVPSAATLADGFSRQSAT